MLNESINIQRMQNLKLSCTAFSDTCPQFNRWSTGIRDLGIAKICRQNQGQKGQEYQGLVWYSLTINITAHPINRIWGFNHFLIPMLFFQ